MGALAAICGGCGIFNFGAKQGRPPKPSEMLTLAVICSGRMGDYNMNAFLRDPHVMHV